MSSYLFILVLFCSIHQTSSLSITIKNEGDTFDHDANISVYWEGIPSPNVSDILSVHSLGQSSQRIQNYLVFKWANSSSSWQQGTGNIVFEGVLNTRSPFVVRYWSNSSVIATSNTVTPNAHYPLQAHLAPTEDPKEMRLTWVSGLSTEAPVPSAVYYGVDSSTWQYNISSVARTYSKQDFADCKTHTKVAVDNFFDPGWIHSAVFGPLLPDTLYYYWFGWGNDTDVSVVRGPFSFRSRPDPSKPIEQTKILYLADMGIGPANEFERNGDLGHEKRDSANDGDNTFGKPTMKGILNTEDLTSYDMALHNGDMSYATGTGVVWDYWHDLIEPVSRVLPYLVSLGNHEYDHSGQDFKPSWGNYRDDSGGECGIPTFARFPLPNNFSADTPYYSVDVGLVHVVVTSIETNFTTGSPQLAWLDRDLAKVDRSVTPWVVVAHHREMYGGIVPDLEFNQRLYLEPVYEKYGVDFVISGHVHAYWRTCPLLNFTCVPNGIVHVVDGMAGAYQARYSTEDYIVYAENTHYGYSRITADRKKLFFEHVSAADGTVIDSFTLNVKPLVDAVPTADTSMSATAASQLHNRDPATRATSATGKKPELLSS